MHAQVEESARTRREGLSPLFCIGYDEKVFIPEGMLPAECITDVGAIDVNKAFNFFVERVRELERQNKELGLWNYEFQREVRRLQFQLKQAQKEANK